MTLRMFGALALVVLLVAVACGGGSPASQRPTSQATQAATTAPTGGTETTAPTAGGSETTAPTAGGGAGTITIGAGEPITVGTLLVITTADADLGIDSQAGAVVAANLHGDVLGHPIEFNHQDDLCSSEGGTAGARALVADPQIVAIIGTSCSSAGVPASQIATDAGVLMVSPSNTAPSLTADDRTNVFYARTAHNDEVQGAAMAQFAREVLNVTTASSVHDGSPYSEQLQQVFRDEFEAAGGTLAGDAQAVAPTDTDFRTVLETIAAGDPELIYYPIFTAGGALMTQQARENPDLEGVHLAGADGMQSATFLEAAGEAALGLYASGPDLNFAGDFYEAEFLPAYEEVTGSATPLSVFHAHAYDAMNMLIQAIEETAVQNDDGSLTIDRQALRDRFFAFENYEGLTGNLTCDENGDCADPKISVSEVAETAEVGEENCGAVSGTVCFNRIWPTEE
jgi:branched-chain amino acid transport system substrate-binding protein